MIKKFTKFRTNRRGGFTLVELLVVVLIITILATIVLFAMFAATEAARAARTRSMVARINDLLLPIWESYRTRRVPIPIPANTTPTTAAGLRVDGLRALMRMELPDRKSDIVQSDNSITTSDASNTFAAPALTRAYYRQAVARVKDNDLTNWSTANQGSECLYLILSRIQDGETNGLEFVRETEIGDVDEDGMLEILDGWGKPIAFLRWAPGFTSDVATTAYQKAPANADPDPFDPLGVRGSPPDTYYLYPLIFSAGPDREYDISTNASDPTMFEYRTLSPANDPFTATITPQLGTPDTSSGNFIDNIHNHLISTGVD